MSVNYFCRVKLTKLPLDSSYFNPIYVIILQHCFLNLQKQKLNNSWVLMLFSDQINNKIMIKTTRKPVLHSASQSTSNKV